MAVMHTLKRRITKDKIEDVSSVLPKELKKAWEE